MQEGFAQTGVMPLSRSPDPDGVQEGTVFAMVVTYQRRDLVLQCLAALLDQTRRPDRIVVVDNGSTDGTYEAICGSGLDLATVEVIRLDPNRGSARGYWQGVSHCYAEGADWVWMMDDDVIPDPPALEALMDVARRHFPDPAQLGFLCSRVVAPSGASMNVPDVYVQADEAAGYPDWERFLDEGLVRLQRATLVSTLVPRATLARHPPSCPDFFIWGEDSDFTLRITREKPAYLVGRSRVLHLRKIAAPPSAASETDPARLQKMYYRYRNSLYVRRRFYPPGHVIDMLLGSLAQGVRALGRGNLAAARAILGGALASFWFRPVYPRTGDARLLAEQTVLLAAGAAGPRQRRAG
jgi:dTDP-4-dehydrorhamnose reductase